MEDWHKYLISDSAPLKQAVALLGNDDPGFVIILDAIGQLTGVLTDASVRKWSLIGISTDDTIVRAQTKYQNWLAANTSYLVTSPNAAAKATKPTASFSQDGVNVLLDNDKRPCAVRLEAPLVQPVHAIPVLLMVGGNGHRLRPLTDNCPKPLLKVGGKPILQRTIEGLVKEGFQRFYLSVHYRAEMIESFIGDGAQFGARVTYLKEEQMMGTAGSIKLIPDRIDSALVVMNGDLFTDVRISRLLAYHKTHSAVGTMAVAPHEVKIPYGVVETHGEFLAQVREKPTLVSYINAGMYVLEPEAVRMIPDGSFYDMPSLFEKLLAQNAKTCVFPLREEWIDIGSIQTYDMVCRRFEEGDKNAPIDFAVPAVDVVNQTRLLPAP